VLGLPGREPPPLSWRKASRWCWLGC